MMQFVHSFHFNQLKHFKTCSLCAIHILLRFTIIMSSTGFFLNNHLASSKSMYGIYLSSSIVFL